MVEGLTRRENDALQFIVEYMAVNGFAPSRREVAAGLYVSNPVAQKHIASLYTKGSISLVPKIPRSITIVRH